MWVLGRLPRGLGKVLGWSADSGEARATELHGRSAMADDGKGERRVGAPVAPFIHDAPWRRVQGFLGTDKPARAAVGQRRPRRPRRRRMAARRVAARRLACRARGPSSGDGATRVANDGGEEMGRRRR
jgi:hypothetical protein